MAALTGFLIRLRDLLRQNKISLLNVLITVGIVMLERVFSDNLFRCPCRDRDEAVPLLYSSNWRYGMVFLFVPAMMLMIIGFALNAVTWKIFTGICRRSRRACGIAGCRAIFAVVMRSLIAPTAWICIALLDGRYFACAWTKKPYKESCDDVYNAPGYAKFSAEYYRNKSLSQVHGWTIAGISFGLGCLVFTISRCCSPLVYQQLQYVTWTKDIENEEFENIAKEEIRKNAQKYITKFFEDGPCLESWDSVTKPFYVSIEKGGKFETYSQLQKWHKASGGEAEERGKSNHAADISVNGDVANGTPTQPKSNVESIPMTAVTNSD